MPVLEKIYNRFHEATSRPEEKGEYSSGYWQDMIRQNAKDMCKSHEGRLLEVGCGEGLFLAQAIAAFPDCEIWGVDAWQEILTKARKRIEGLRPGAVIMKSDAASLPFENAFFDTVVCINVLFNMESIEKVRCALKEMSRVCKPGGRIVFDFRNSLNPLLVAKYKLARYYDSTVRDLHLNTYNPKHIRAILSDLHLEIVEERSLFLPVKTFSPIIMIEAVKKI